MANSHRMQQNTKTTPNGAGVMKPRYRPLS
jgi:hypothetical protein